MCDAATAAATLAADLKRLRQSDPASEAIAATITIEGPTSLVNQHFRSLLAELTDSDGMLGSFNFMLQRLTLNLTPIVELEKIAQGNDLCARLAQIILDLNKDDNTLSSSIGGLFGIIDEVNTAPIFSGALEPLASDDGHRLLREVAEELLHELLAQRDETSVEVEATTES